MNFQVADVQRPLISVTALASKGNTVNFHDKGGVITNVKTKRSIKFTRRRGVYVLDIAVPPFQGPGR